MVFDPWYFIIILPGFLLSIWAQSKVKGNFQKYSQVRNSAGLTGAQTSREGDFTAVRHGLDHARLAELFEWTEAEFLARMEGSAIRRIGYERWSRNLAVGLGNAKIKPGCVIKLKTADARFNGKYYVGGAHFSFAASMTGLGGGKGMGGYKTHLKLKRDAGQGGGG